MNRVVIFAGRDGSSEHYTLLTGREFVTAEYNGASQGRPEFLDNTAREFSEIIAARMDAMEVGFMNGFKLTNGELGKIEKLEDLNSLGTRLFSNLSQLTAGRAAVISAGAMN